MTFEEFQDSKGRKTSNHQDYEEYLAFLQQNGAMNKAVAKKQLTQQAPKTPANTAPTQIQGQQNLTPSLEGATLTDGTGIAGKVNSQGSIINPNKTSIGVQQPTVPAQAPITPPVTDGPGFFDKGGAWDQTEFVGDAKGVAGAGMMAMQTANAQTASQAIMGGAMTGMSVGSMLAGAAAGPAGIAVGVGTALIGLANASSSRRKQENAKAEAEKKQKEEQQKAEKLRLLESYNSRRQRAYESLMGAFR